MTKALPDPISRNLVETVIEAATWAPNHRRTQPWRFVVVTGTARDALGRVFADALRRRLGESGGEPSETELEKERNKPLRAPVVIAVAAMPPSNPRDIEVEEIAATSAGIQNMLLAAQALGLGAMWRTGDTAYDAAIKVYLGFPADAHLLAFIYLGYPDIIPPLSRLDNSREKTTWLTGE